MSEPVTEADREKARELRVELGWQEMAYPTPEQLVAYLRQCPDAIAEETTSRLIAASQEAAWCRQGDHERELEHLRAALADEREKARAPFLALAERLQEQADNWVGWADGAMTLLAFADQIDAASEGDQ